MLWLLAAVFTSATLRSKLLRRRELSKEPVAIPGDSEMETSKSTVLREVWRIARPYWFSEERWVARGLLAAILAMNFAQVWINVRLNSWRNDFYNALQNYDEAAFFHQIGLFALPAGAFIALLVYRTYLQQMLQIRWRRWFTNVFLKELFPNKAYLRQPMARRRPNNTHQATFHDLNL